MNSKAIDRLVQLREKLKECETALDELASEIAGAAEMTAKRHLLTIKEFMLFTGKTKWQVWYMIRNHQVQYTRDYNRIYIDRDEYMHRLEKNKIPAVELPDVSSIRSNGGGKCRKD